MAKTVRVPDDLYAKIQKLAAKEKRSVTNMVSVLLTTALEKK